MADVTALSEAVAGQPLLARYGTTAEGLSRSLSGALSRGEGLVLAEEGPIEAGAAGAIDVPTGGAMEAARAAGFAWFLREGTFASGGYLRLIALAPGAEGRGIGGMLLDEVERGVAERSGSIFLLVSEFNAGARRFYAGRGYGEAGKLPAFVRADVDEIVMWKRLAR